MHDTKKLLDDILYDLTALKREDLQSLANRVFKMLSADTMQDDSVYGLTKENDSLFCKKCGSVHYVKNGKNQKGHQKYRCRDCGSVFTAVSSSVFSYTHKKSDKWKEFICLTLEGYSLRDCAKKCNISPTTAFHWRHKILVAAKERQFVDRFSGIVEIDEMFVNVSYKGNHSKSKSFVMPRKAFKRGSDNRSSSARDKACVLCVAAREKSFSGVVTHRGALNTSILSEVFDGQITDETIVLTDASHAMMKYFKEQPYEYISLPGSVTGSKIRSVPVVKGPYHINNINALHGRFRAFLGQYKGVATKHLNQYLALFLWIENRAKNNDHAIDETVDLMLNTREHIIYDKISSIPLPKVI